LLLEELDAGLKKASKRKVLVESSISSNKPNEKSE
jgi:hypothetical protein